MPPASSAPRWRAGYALGATRLHALVRPAKAGRLAALGCELVQGDLAESYVVQAHLEQVDALVHAAGVYRVGVAPADRQPMWAANVDGTESVLAAAKARGVGKVVYVSSVIVLGNTCGDIVHETHTSMREFTSYYEETKHRAHEVARRFAAAGLPCVTVLPGAVYGPGDPSQVGDVVERFRLHRLPMMPFPDLGLTFVHRDDVAAGVLLALDAGRPGAEYILGGEIATMRDVVETVARLTGRTAPTRRLPTGVLKAIAPVAPVLGRLTGLPRNVREIVSSSDRVTFWVTDRKARRELGYSPRSLEDGLRDTSAGR